eukprot:TRINITY_DN5306_c0_g2_i1.p1 TRINITY_DN5306_c0_g2~~TRINITY_DN5306_c0_g2_i1.p1  ORF type:complete len:759 (-),score=142.47 TRINITY_DN5306_c0_g2_i1:75-2351(-)
MSKPWGGCFQPFAFACQIFSGRVAGKSTEAEKPSQGHGPTVECAELCEALCKALRAEAFDRSRVLELFSEIDVLVKELTARRLPAESERSPLEVLDKLCDGGEDVCRVAALNLLRHHELAAGTEQIVSWGQLKLMVQNLEASWGTDHEDTQLIVNVMKRGAFRACSQANAAQLPRSPMGPGSVPQMCRTPTQDKASDGVSTAQFLEFWPSALKKVRQRYRPHTRTIVSRRHFLRKKTVTSLEDNYEHRSDIGSGAYGAVALCTHRLTGSLRAVKTLPKEKLAKETESGELLREFEVLATLDHPNIIRVFEVFDDNDAAHIVMEPVLGGTLKDVIKMFKTETAQAKRSAAESGQVLERWIADVTRQLLNAVWYAHEQGVVHKDLKPLNVLLTKTSVKARPQAVVCDFGIAEHVRPSSATRLRNFGGTPAYMAPEVWEGNFGPKADLWSIGVILFEMLSGGTLPFNAENVMALYREVTLRTKLPNFEVLGAKGGQQLCSVLLEKDEAKRLTAPEALTQCAEWLQQGLEEDNSPTNNCATAAVANEIANLGKRSHLEQCVMACVASQLNVHRRAEKVTEVFQRMDVDGSGTLSKEEMSVVFMELGVQEAEADILMRSLDTDADGLIEYSEFIAGCMSIRREEVLQQLRLAFSIFDTDNSGYLDRAELDLLLRGSPAPDASTATATPRRVASRINVAGGPSAPAPPMATTSSGPEQSAMGFAKSLLPDGTTVDEMLEELDSSGDGRVSFDEFKDYLMRCGSF